MSVPVCLLVSLSAHIPREPRPNFTCDLFWRRYDTLYFQFVFVFWRLPIIDQAKATQTGRLHKMTHQGQYQTGAKSDIYDCFVQCGCS